MMRINTLSGTREMITESGTTMELRYYLVQDSCAGKQKKNTYGVGIVKAVAGEAEEREWIPGITHSRPQVEKLLRRMIDGAVTPVSAVSVADDFMGM